MRKLSFLLLIIAFVTACNNSSGDKSTDTKENTEAKPAESATAPEDPEAERGLALIAKSDCLTCHKVDEPSTGPSYMSVAAKYGNTTAVVDTLSQKIIKGGTGNWGTIPMIAHPTISAEDAKAMVHYVLSLKK